MRDLQVFSLVVAAVAAIGALARRRGVRRMETRHINHKNIHCFQAEIYKVVHGVAENEILKNMWRI